MQTKSQPHSVEAEQAVIGGLLLAGERGMDSVGEILRVTDFYRIEHQLIFSSLLRLQEQRQAFDPITVCDDLQSRGELDKAGGSSYVSDICANTPSAANIRSYAKIVQDASVERQILAAAHSIAEIAYDGQISNVVEKINMAQQVAMEIQTGHASGDSVTTFHQASQRVIEAIERRQQRGSGMIGVSSGFLDLDKITGGLPPKDYILLAGRPSMGKSAAALNIAEHTAKEGHLTIFFSLEMDMDSLLMRLYSSQANIPIEDIRKGNMSNGHWDQLGRAAGRLKNIPLYIDDTPRLNPAMIRSRIRRIQRKEDKPVGLVVIDYLQKMRATERRRSREEEISDISGEMKDIAKEFDCPVIALSQLNRDLEKRPSNERRPRTSDLRESGSLEQDADIIVFVYRDEVYNPGSNYAGTAELIISKHRNGRLGKVYLRSDLEYSRFQNSVNAKPVSEPEPDAFDGFDIPE